MKYQNSPPGLNFGTIDKENVKIKNDRAWCGVQKDPSNYKNLKSKHLKCFSVVVWNRGSVKASQLTGCGALCC